MKKGFKAVTAAALAVSALTPVAAFAAESTVDNGVYTTSNYYSIDAFKKLSGSAKAAALTSEGAVIVVDGKVYTGNNVITLSDSQLGASAVTVDAYNAANGNKLVSGKPIGGENQTGDLKVESVSAINGSQLEVKFSKAVDKSTVVGAANALTGIAIQAVGTATATGTLTSALSTDGKTLTISNTNAFKGDYVVSTSSTVKDTDGKAVVTYAGPITVKDVVAPTVKELKYTSQFEVTFSEPLSTTTTNLVVRVNGEPVTGTLTNNTLTFSKAGLTAGSTASVYVAGLTDVAGNNLTAYTGSVQVPNDTTPVTVKEVKQTASNVFQVEFNKAIDKGAAADAKTAVSNALTVLKSGTALTRTTDWTVAPTTGDTTGTKFDVTIAVGGATSPNFGFYTSGNTANLTLVFADKALQDAFGNKNAEIVNTLSMTKDTVAPKVVSVKLDATNANILVTFDEKLATTLGAGSVVLRKDGVAVTTGTVVVDTTDTKVLKIPVAGPATAFEAGTYTVRLEADTVKDLYTNSNEAANAGSVTVTGSATDLTATTANDTGSNHFTVTYSEAVKSASALNASNYKLDGADLPAGTDIYFDGTATTTKVHIVLPQDSINIGDTTTGTNARLSVANVESVTGKTVVGTSGNVLIKDNTAAKLVSASFITADILKLTFDENVKMPGSPATFDLSDIEITNGTETFALAAVAPATTAATLSATVSGKEVIITVDKGDSNWTAATTGTVTVKTLSGIDLTDANGLTVKKAVSVTTTK